MPYATVQAEKAPYTVRFPSQGDPIMTLVTVTLLVRLEVGDRIAVLSSAHVENATGIPTYRHIAG